MEQRKVLDSWKAIADYLNRNSRTCMRWEQEMGLPVRRLDGSPRARVFAFPEEIDRWLEEKVRERGAEANGLPKGMPIVPFWTKGLIAGLAAAVIVAAAAIAFLLHRQARVRWANDVAIPEIERLLLLSEDQKVFDLAVEAEKAIPDSPRLARLMPQAAGTLTVETDPPGAAVFIARYGQTPGEWKLIGSTPIEGKRLAQGYRMWRIEKGGFETAVGTAFIRAGLRRTIRMPLPEKGHVPAGMAHVSEGAFAPNFFNMTHQESVILPSYSMDAYEVTNRRFKAFVDAGGYARPEFWKEPFVEGGRAVPPAEAMKRFTDRTGRPGPATWSDGTCPPGEDDFPVRGVSWYEAAAFAAFEGKVVPTVYHWVRTAGDYLTDSGFIIPASNFGGKGPARVGSYPSLGPCGTYDMAGNVKEWCWNETEGKRFILGGAWDEDPYMFGVFDARDAFRREADFGFRCMKTDEDGPPGPELAAPLTVLRTPDYRKFVPCNDELYQVYARMFEYTRLDLRSRVESRRDWSDRAVVEKATFDDATGASRMIAYIFLPKQGRPPYQTVVYFPGVGAQRMASSFDYTVVKNREVDLFTNSGRAFVFPVLTGTFERREQTAGPWTNERRRETRMREIRDFMRTIDYLETRPEFDRDKLAYVGLSWGGYVGSQVLALEKRLKAGVFLAAGLDCEDYQPDRYQPEIDPINFIPRVKVPVLIVHGRYDFISPLETEAFYIKDLLGTPEKDKVLLVKETGHNVWQLNETRKDVFVFLDKYLGPVRKD